MRDAFSGMTLFLVTLHLLTWARGKQLNSRLDSTCAGASCVNDLAEVSISDASLFLLQVDMVTKVRSFTQRDVGEQNQSWIKGTQAEKSRTSYICNHSYPPTPGPEANLTEQILALIPYTIDDRARYSIRSQGIIQKAEQWMRENVAWDGFNETDSLAFWRGLHPSQVVQWEGQPNRFDGSPLRQLNDLDWWSKVTFAHTLYDNLGDGEYEAETLKAMGTYFNRFRGLEYFDSGLFNRFRLQEWDIQPVEHDLPFESRSFKPYVDPPYKLRFECSNDTSATEAKMYVPSHRSSTPIRGPGIALRFRNIWKFDESGMPKTYRSSVVGEQWVSKEENERIWRAVRRVTSASS